MTLEMIVCPMCGFRYDPQANQSCSACPMKRNCQLVCCPACGHETVDPKKSILARTVDRLVFSRRRDVPENTE